MKKSFLHSIVLSCIAFFSCIDDKLENVADLDNMNEIPSNVAKPVLRITLPASWDENWFSSPAVYDLDNDGTPEIIASRHSVLYIWNSVGTLRWRAPVGENATSPNDHGTHRMYCSPAVGDLDGDGMGEIAISYNNAAAVYDHDGNLHTGWPKTFPGPTGEIRSIASADINNDGACEILVVKTSEGPVTNIWSVNGAQITGWPQVTDHITKNDYGGYNQNIGAADLDGNGVADIVCTYDICHIGVFYASGECWPANPMFKGPYSCNVPMFHDINLAILGWGADYKDRDEFTDSPPVFADMDNDGMPEIILFSDHELAGEYVNRGNSLWVLNPDMTRVESFKTPLTTDMPLYTGYQDNIVQVAPSPCISYLGGASCCVVVPSYDGNIRCYDKDGSVLWKIQFDASGGAFTGASEAVAGDLDNDGIVEIVFTTYSIESDRSYLIILNRQGQLLHRIRISGRGSMAAPTLADVDADTVLEIIISLKDVVGGGLGGVQIWDVASAKLNTLDWPTGRGNYKRTGMFRAF